VGSALPKAEVKLKGNHKKNLKTCPIFQPEKVTVNSPRITIKPPQLHHQKTTSNPPFFQKLPTKTRKTPPQQTVNECGASPVAEPKVALLETGRGLALTRGLAEQAIDAALLPTDKHL
jgi:hypothetical protein